MFNSQNDSTWIRETCRVIILSSSQSWDIKKISISMATVGANLFPRRMCENLDQTFSQPIFFSLMDQKSILRFQLFVINFFAHIITPLSNSLIASTTHLPFKQTDGKKVSTRPECSTNFITTIQSIYTVFVNNEHRN